MEMGLPFGNDMLGFVSVPRMLWVRVKTSDITSCQLRFDIATNFGQIVTTIRDDVTLTTNDTWEWVELGPVLITLSNIADNYVSSQYDRFRIYAQVATSNTVDLDVSGFMPVADGGYVIADFPATVSTTDDFRIDGRRREIIRVTEGVPAVYAGSGIWELQPGYVTNRLDFQFFATDGEHTLGDTARVKLQLIPRTMSLLGTI